MKNIIHDEISRNLKLMGLTESNEMTNINEFIPITPVDSDPKNLNIEFIQKNSRFANLLNTILFELYSDNLGWNEDETKKGILNIYPLNEFTNWSILNYFGGHKYIKNKLLERFKKSNKGDTPKDFYYWVIQNRKNLFTDGPFLQELIRTNMATYNKGSITEKYVIDKLKNSKYTIKYFPPGSKQDRDYGIDLEINGKTFQVKELTNMLEQDGKLILGTPLPKDYNGKKVANIMLVDIKTGDYVTFPNRDYSIDIENKCYVLNNNKIKKGNFNKI